MMFINQAARYTRSPPGCLMPARVWWLGEYCRYGENNPLGFLIEQRVHGGVVNHITEP